MKNNPIGRKTNIVVQEVESELLVYDLKINKAYCLNQTSALVYQFCDGTKAVADIRDELSRKLKMSVGEELVWLALDQLRRDNLLENHQKLEINFGGLSRREIIQKIGFASMVTLPFISSIVAPKAANAASCADTICANQCVNTFDDPNNCGACGKVCSTQISNATSACVNGSCRIVCNPGLTQCSNQCVNTSNDSNNCGACGNKCSTGQICSGGVCV